MSNTDTRSVEAMNIGGWVRLSTCDWPGRLVTTVFCQGCPWRCGYCHNPDLIPMTPAPHDIPIPYSDVLEHLHTRVGLLDGIVFSGGEPTAQRGLRAAMESAKELGFGIGVHTSGAYPGRLASILDVVDWVGLDIKAPRERYAAITKVSVSADRAWRSLDYVLKSGVDYEIRTTVDPAILGSVELDSLATELAEKGAKPTVHQIMR